MKHLFVLLLTCCIAFASPVLAEEEQRSDGAEEATPAAKPKRKSYKGTIKSIDLDARGLVVAMKTSSKTFTVAADAQIKTVEKEYATLADLREGDLINLRFTVDGETNTVSRITRSNPVQESASSD
ncbi:hypothetical protein BH20VER1_BH20VER1_29620 [soil metagenome]|jgi:Cu/Ag efflux protein CusF